MLVKLFSSEGIVLITIQNKETSNIYMEESEHRFKKEMLNIHTQNILMNKVMSSLLLELWHSEANVNVSQCHSLQKKNAN